ncbi:hypothetical protein ACQEVY_25310 [Streptomyces sp. CA-288835]|uniref:hypothetical protein n=1 Tax=Streptomyces sp. CA-288835 TaxID=3240069 RepID=UPI003D90BAB3
MSANEWKINPHTDSIQYLGGWLTDPTYRGCIVRESSGRMAGKWAVCPRDPWTEEDHAVTYAGTVEEARKALENVTPGGHKCEVLVNQYLGHCPERACVVTYSWEDDKPVRGLLLCRVHKVKTFADAFRVSVEEWETGNGPITHESGPIIGERISPAMAPVKRSDFLSQPVIWGDDWGSHVLGMKLAQDVMAAIGTGADDFVSTGDLVVFKGTGAFEVKSVDVIEIPGAGTHYRFSCNGGATYLAEHDSAVPVLYLPF